MDEQQIERQLAGGRGRQPHHAAGLVTIEFFQDAVEFGIAAAVTQAGTCRCRAGLAGISAIGSSDRYRERRRRHEARCCQGHQNRQHQCTDADQPACQDQQQEGAGQQRHHRSADEASDQLDRIRHAEVGQRAGPCKQTIDRWQEGIVIQQDHRQRQAGRKAHPPQRRRQRHRKQQEKTEILQRMKVDQAAPQQHELEDEIDVPATDGATSGNGAHCDRRWTCGSGQHRHGSGTRHHGASAAIRRRVRFRYGFGYGFGFSLPACRHGWNRYR